MKRFKNIKYEFRPESYWRTPEGLAGLLVNVMGANRRSMIRDFWRQGRIKELDKALLKPVLTKRQRESLGQIDPTFLGGEFLPAYQTGEKEVARIELKSVTSDVVSIRAKPVGSGISFRILDEYHTRFRVAQRTSRQPLTLAELVRLIEESEHPELGPNLALCYNRFNAKDDDRQYWLDFTSLHSDFYTQLDRHFQKVFETWAHCKDRAKK